MIDSRGSTFYRATTRPALDAPAPRPRIFAATPIVAERHGRTEGTDGEVTLADTNAVIFTASGLPDLWVLTARTNGALVVMDDIAAREDDAITVLAGFPVQVRLPRRRIQARNLVAGSNAALSVTAYYAQPGEPFEAPA
jgi:hypothetical protein